MSKLDIVTRLRQEAARRGVKVVELANGHFQLHGPHFMVNYYPLSKKKTAYLKGTTQGVEGCEPSRALAMALNLPQMVPKHLRDTHANSRPIRRKMLAGREECKCHWCTMMITLDTSTLDYVIPLSRGGLDNANNRVLACEPCNGRRGSQMPETKIWKNPDSDVELLSPPQGDPPW